MKGVLRMALQFYGRTRTQRRLLAVALLLFTAQLAATRLACPCPPAFNPWPILLWAPVPALAAMIGVYSASDFMRISSLRTVFLIPNARPQLIGSMFLAQLIVAAVGTAVVVIVGHAQPIAPLAWGSARGTFESLLGGALTLAVLLQLFAGPSRILSAAAVALPAAVGLRPDLFLAPEILGMSKAHVLAITGILSWLLFAVWFVNAWHPAAPFSAWKSRGRSAAGVVAVSREMAIRAFLLGQPSLLRACRKQLTTWMASNVAILVTLAGMQLLTRNRIPANFSMPIIILLFAPVVGINSIAGSVACGSRRLWLRSGASRSELYTIAARLAWRSLAVFGIPFAGLALLELRFLPHAGLGTLYPVAICLTMIPGALYLGLLNFHQRVNLSFLVLYTAGAAALFAGVWVEASQGRQLLWIAPIALFAIGFALRSFARRRWYGIDWLKFRAQRIPASSAFTLR